MVDRREILKTAGTAATAGMVGLAGCLGTQDDDDDGGTDDTPDDGTDDTPDETADNGAVTEPDEFAIRLGLAIPVTGTVGPVGIAMQDGIQMAVNRFEAEYDNFEFDIVTEDTQYAPEEGLRAAQRLVEQDDADILIGPANSASAQSAGEFAAENNIIQMNPAASANYLTDSPRR